jgi:SHS2 domain-containing protein
MAGWEHFHHEADIGVRGTGATKAEAFGQAALAMMAVIASPQTIADKEPVELTLSAADDDMLLFEWLNALVYEMATRRMLFSRFDLEIVGARLQGRIWGERIDRLKHQPAVEVKGATFTELAVKRSVEGIWTAQCVIDV